ncbi:bifunctional 3-(3-hydroxy-phenyl)propionate/3-hydroxycinnamic acid hydroxylase [Amphritea sp.]|uniref:bifunctional 3-(3-hydroxy-phenyl)propionate/3-hydroxycinnamic acid hydroxylase n=1 Tax=Amphritea sp. TaxID=1872502 RepID=UPI003A8CEBDF
MTADNKTNDVSTDYLCKVAILGAGPVGLTIANYLGQAGVDVIVLERLDKLIDYPRAIGIDDESLRTIQSVGLIDEVLPHTTPHHAMRFLTPKGRCFADIQPMTDEFGWSRRNAFIQPQVDAVLYRGLSRFKNVKVMFSRNVQAFEQDDKGVTIHADGPEGQKESIRADYLVACDGGNSYVRSSLGISFDGKTAPNQWIVVDIANDPLATPNVYLCADPERPYVSAALPHATRRFEFMVMPGETEEQLSQPENMRKLLAKVLPNPDNVELIRSRVYTHNARLAGEFRKGRVLLAGDAAHIMPVWQGQGYNSGMRDAFNLAWKLALVVQGSAGEQLLDSYEVERRDHAKAMIDLSVLAGHVLAPPKRWQGTLRDGLSWVMGFVPPVKRYFLEMRFKPMPKYDQGALVEVKENIKGSPVGKMFIQPKVLTEQGPIVLLDEVIGTGFAVIAWGADPTWGLNDRQVEAWKALGANFIQVLPDVQMKNGCEVADGVIRVGDVQGRLKDWFGQYPASIAVIRPDRFVGAVAIPQTLGQVTEDYLRVLQATPVCAEDISAPHKREVA